MCSRTPRKDERQGAPLQAGLASSFNEHAGGVRSQCIFVGGDDDGEKSFLGYWICYGRHLAHLRILRRNPE